MSAYLTVMVAGKVDEIFTIGGRMMMPQELRG
jgi:hypothetical protein